MSRGQKFWNKPTFLLEFKVYDHGLSPLPMQNAFQLEVDFGINVLFVIGFPKMFAARFTTNLWLNIGKKIIYFIICKLKIIQEHAFSKASFSTLR